MTNIKKIENRAKKILEWINNKNYSQEELVSFNYNDLLSNLHMKLFKNPLIEDEYYVILQMIIEKCTSLNADDFPLLYGTNMDSQKFINDFNFQMAQYFDEDII